MNGKVVFGSDFTACLQYVLEKDEAQLLETNLLGRSVLEYAAEFRLVASCSGRIVKPVMHLSLSPHPDDVLENEDKSRFTHQLLAELGMGNCQYLIAEHQDTITPEGQPRPHLHIVANRIPLDQNKAVNSSWMKRRVEKALQKLRDEFDLQPVVASWEVERSAPSTGQTRRYRREQQEYEEGIRSRLPQLPIKVQLQDAIDIASTTLPTLPELILDLQRQGIETKVYFNQSHAIGISYSKEGIAFSGSTLGKAYSLPGLQQYRHVSYQPTRDNPLIEQLKEHSFESFEDMTDQIVQASSQVSEQPLQENQVIEELGEDLLESIEDIATDDEPTTVQSSSQVSEQPLQENQVIEELREDSLFEITTDSELTTMQDVEPVSLRHPEDNQQQRAEQVIPVILKLLDYYDSDELDNGRYQIHRLEKGQQVVLNRSDSLFSVLGFNLEDGETKIWSNQLQSEDEVYFGAIANTLRELESAQTVTVDEEDEESEDWQKAREQLQLDYGIPQALSQVLYEQGQLETNAEGKTVFVKQSIENADKALFWFSTGSHPQRIVITESPVEAISAFLVEDAKPTTKPTVYLGIEPEDEIPTQFLKQFDDVLISVEDEKLEKQLEKIVSKAKFVTLLEGSWQDTWQSQQQSTKQPKQHKRSFERSRQRQLQL